MVQSLRTFQSLLPQVFPEDISGSVAVIDRETMKERACEACGCADCFEARSSCEPLFPGCISDLTSVLVEAHFKSNLQGLGVDGFGWEEGIKSALLAVGLIQKNQVTRVPVTTCCAEGAPNTFVVDGQESSWIRDDAVLAVAFVTDEEDCSMPTHLMQLRHQYEENGMPVGSICYQPEQRERFLDVSEMAGQLLVKKGEAQSRLTVSLIAGVSPDEGELGWRDATGTSCRSEDDGAVSSTCHCFAGASAQDYADWCQFTPGPTGAGACDALAGSRYVQFTRSFERRSFESICTAGDSAFGPGIAPLCSLATEACFALDELAPHKGDPANIVVKRRAREQDASSPMEVLDFIGDSGERGWYYDGRENKICLSRIERRIGDEYSVLVVHANEM